MKGRKYRSKESTALEALYLRVFYNPQPGDMLVGTKLHWLTRATYKNIKKVHGAETANQVAIQTCRHTDVFIVGVTKRPDTLANWHTYQQDALISSYVPKDNHGFSHIEYLEMPDEGSPSVIRREEQYPNYVQEYHKNEDLLPPPKGRSRLRRKEEQILPPYWWSLIKLSRKIVPYDTPLAGDSTMAKILTKKFEVVELDLLALDDARNDWLDTKGSWPGDEPLIKEETSNAMLATVFNPSRYSPNFSTLLFDKGSGQMPTIVASAETYEEAVKAHKDYFFHVLDEEIALEADLEYNE